MNPVRLTLLLARWQFNRQSQVLPLLVIVQLILAAATVVGYGLLIGETSDHLAVYLATGAPTVTLIIAGLVMTPQFVLTAKTEGSFEWMRTLPIPRTLFLISDLLVWTLLALPGMVVGLIAGVLRFDVTLSMSPLVAVVALLISLTAASVGYAVATLLPQVLAQMVTQLLVFVVLLFSPVSFPADRLPQWLATVHDYLPIAPMADLMRATLVADRYDLKVTSLVVLAAWCAGCVTAVFAVLRRRV